MTNLELAAKIRAARKAIDEGFHEANKDRTPGRDMALARVIGRAIAELSMAAIEAEYVDRNVSRPDTSFKEAA